MEKIKETKIDGLVVRSVYKIGDWYEWRNYSLSGKASNRRWAFISAGYKK